MITTLSDYELTAKLTELFVYIWRGDGICYEHHIIEEILKPIRYIDDPDEGGFDNYILEGKDNDAIFVVRYDDGLIFILDGDDLYLYRRFDEGDGFSFKNSIWKPDEIGRDDYKLLMGLSI